MRTIVKARNPVWADAEHTAIHLDVDFAEIAEEFVPFTAAPWDTEIHGQELFVRAANGEFGPVAPYVPPVESLDVIQARLDAAVTAWIDGQAAKVGFRNAAYIVSYWDSTNPQWQAAARAFVPWRDSVWVTCIAIVDAVKAGQQAVPTEAELLAELPPFVLP